jgi:hypothetical protein
MDYIPAYNFDLLPILLSIIFLSIVVLWVAIKNYQNFLLMFLIIPLTIFSGWTAYSTVDKLLGYPVFAKIEDDAFYITHVEDPMGDFIFVWLVNPGELKPKSVMVVNSKENKESLEDAKEKTESGIPQMIKQKQVEGQGQTLGGELEIYDFQQQGVDVMKDQQMREEKKEEPKALPGKVHTRPATSTPSTRPRLDAERSSEIPETYRFVRKLNVGGK